MTWGHGLEVTKQLTLTLTLTLLLTINITITLSSGRGSWNQSPLSRRDPERWAWPEDGRGLEVT